VDGESPGIRPVVPPPGILNLGRASARPLSCRTTANPFATRCRPGLQRNNCSQCLQRLPLGDRHRGIWENSVTPVEQCGAPENTGDSVLLDDPNSQNPPISEGYSIFLRHWS
jgi:hypothetical protein